MNRSMDDIVFQYKILYCNSASQRNSIPVNSPSRCTMMNLEFNLSADCREGKCQKHLGVSL